jgi:6-phosphogluconate dehydrogenase
MQLGMVGAGRMGANMVRRLIADGHRCVITDRDTKALDSVVADGASGAVDVASLVAQLEAPRRVWVMVPAAAVDMVIEQLGEVLEPGDVIIDGGNSYFGDDLARSESLGALGIGYVDVGTSGGVFGLERGFCLMVGGSETDVTELVPIFASLSPGVDAASRTRDATGDLRPGEAGWLHAGPVGAGHFVKMVHNGIEYGAMAALAEGLGVLDAADRGLTDRSDDAETSPMAGAHRYGYDFDLAEITEVWRRGSVISSFLMDLTAQGLSEDPSLDAFDGVVADSGEGRWTTQTAVDLGVPTPVITAALFERFASRGLADTVNRSLSSMRKSFGGHEERPFDR